MGHPPRDPYALPLAQALHMALSFADAARLCDQVVTLASIEDEDERALAYEALLLRAALTHAIGEPPQRSYELYSRAIALEPERWEALTRRGLLALYSGEKDGPSCRSDMEAAFQRGRGASEAIRNAAVLAWDDARMLPEASPERERGFRSAEALYEMALRVDPEDAEALDLRAWLYRDWNKEAEARRDFQAALELFNRLRGWQGFLTRVAYHQRRAAEGGGGDEHVQLCLLVVGRLMGENRRHPIGCTEAGIAQFCGAKRVPQGAGRGEALRQAQGTLDRAISLNPAHWEGWFYRGHIFIQPWEGRDIDRALADFTAAVERVPTHAWSREGRAYCYLLKGDGVGAAADGRVAVEHTPTLAEGWVCWIRGLQLQGREEDAALVEAARARFEAGDQGAVAEVLGRVR